MLLSKRMQFFFLRIYQVALFPLLMLTLLGNSNLNYIGDLGCSIFGNSLRLPQQFKVPNDVLGWLDASLCAVAPPLRFTRPYSHYARLQSFSPPCFPRNKLLFLKATSSPFENFGAYTKKREGNVGAFTAPKKNLELNRENVEMILEEVRPYLIADGGNCTVDRIDDGVVYLNLQGACGDCPSSSVTLKMGIERRLKESIPSLKAVEPVTDSTPRVPLSVDGVEKILDQIRPFLKFTGGKIKVKSVYAPIEGIGSSVTLDFAGKLQKSISQSVKLEIVQRLRKAYPSLVDVKFNDIPLGST